MRTTPVEIRSEAEQEHRSRLGIPDHVRRVLIFGETSHWDPNWLLTSEEYYERRIEPIFEEVIQALTDEPRRVFSMECLFFFQLFWDRCPHRRDTLRQLVNRGQLRLTGTGITTPDTVLPSTEAIIRDYLLGQEWLRKRGMNAEPRLAYLPDDFGCSPALPSILQSLGFDRAGITRIDGMHFIGDDLRLPSAYPLPGSSAELLEKKHRTQAFVWRAPDGSEVLCHWNAFTYFQGDMLAHVGIIRWMGVAYGVPWRTRGHIARRIRGLVRQLEPLAKTPYLFCPIGCDFNGPIRGLVQLLDRFNDEHSASTGIWAVCAGMDDYLDLVDFHRDRLPVLELDPNPYWMGFYATRPNVKRTCNRLVRKLVLAEKLAFRTDLSAAAPSKDLHSAWSLVAVSNHHDFITGTTPDRVYQDEQLPWLVHAEELADRCLDQARRRLPKSDGPLERPAPKWNLEHGLLEVETSHYFVRISERAGGCFVSLRDRRDGEERLAGPGNDLVVYRDSGGLWRMGHEFLGGRFREDRKASDHPARVTAALQDNGLLAVTIVSHLAGERVVRKVWFDALTPVIRMHIEARAAEYTTVSCRFPTVSNAETMAMDVPGGIVERDRSKLYDPTFWPARSFVHFNDPASWGLAAFLGGPACVGMPAPGVLQWVVLRHAPRERAFGVIPILAHPASGIGTSEGGFDYALWLTPGGDYRMHHIPVRGRQALRGALFAPGAQDLDAVASAVLSTDRDEVLISALKPASRGEGVIARLRSFLPPSAAPQVRLRFADHAIESATLCDARERDLEPIEVTDGIAQVPVRRAITSVRLRLASA